MICSTTCLRKLKDCDPISNATCGEDTFICCGESDKNTRSIKEDKYRLCFVSGFDWNINNSIPQEDVK